MPDAMDQQQCDDIVCARGGHQDCDDLPPEEHDARCALNDMNPPPLYTCQKRRLRVGDRLVSNPCDMIVRSLGTTRETLGLAWCRNCAAEHIVDVRLFEAGRGPWKRVTLGTVDPPDSVEVSEG